MLLDPTFQDRECTLSPSKGAECLSLKTETSGVSHNDEREAGTDRRPP